MMQQGLQCGGGSGGERRFDAARQPFIPLYRCRSAAFRSISYIFRGSQVSVPFVVPIVSLLRCRPRRFDAARQPFVHLCPCRSAAF